MNHDSFTWVMTHLHESWLIYCLICMSHDSFTYTWVMTHLHELWLIHMNHGSLPCMHTHAHTHTHTHLSDLLFSSTLLQHTATHCSALHHTHTHTYTHTRCLSMTQTHTHVSKLFKSALHKRSFSQTHTHISKLFKSALHKRSVSQTQVLCDIMSVVPEHDTSTHLLIQFAIFCIIEQ